MEQILTSLQQEIEASYFHKPKLLPSDRWLWLSAWQKGVRRNNLKTALNAAYSLINHDSKSFFIRAAIVACEDVGSSSPDVVAKVLLACTSGKWRKNIGELETGLYITTLLCNAVKTRLADSIYIQAEQSPEFAAIRSQFAKAGDKELAAYVMAEDNNLVARCLALWFLAGTKRYQSDILPMRVGKAENVAYVLNQLHSPEPLKQACIAAIKPSRYPLAIWQPLIWQEIQKYPTSIIYNQIPESPEANGLPYYAADGFTRIGLSCFRELQRTVPCLRDYSARQIGLGVFYLDGGLVDKQLTSAHLEAIQYAGEIADIKSAGLTEEGYRAMRECLHDNWQELTEIRREHLTGITHE